MGRASGVGQVTCWRESQGPRAERHAGRSVAGSPLSRPWCEGTGWGGRNGGPWADVRSSPGLAR